MIFKKAVLGPTFFFNSHLKILTFMLYIYSFSKDLERKHF